MRRLRPQLARLAGSLQPVLIVGDRGSGKRLLAEELHRVGLLNAQARADASPFVAFAGNGAATEVASRLFDPGGLLDQARGGTLFIAEVRSLPAAIQVKLAELIAQMPQREAQSRVRVLFGSRTSATADTDALREGCSALANELDRRLARDARLWLPPLRLRHGDVTFLARVFWTELGGEGMPPDDLLAPFMGHHWPGNVRELRALVADRLRYSAPIEGCKRGARSVSPVVAAFDLPLSEARRVVLETFEKRYVQHRLSHSERSADAATASGLCPRYFDVVKSRALGSADRRR
jgi:DNA-binding NtrC family response regulator